MEGSRFFPESFRFELWHWQIVQALGVPAADRGPWWLHEFLCDETELHTL